MTAARRAWQLAIFLTMLPAMTGCMAMRSAAPRDLGPCADGFADTADGWRLGMRHYEPKEPDPYKAPVVLCHGLGLNGSFWTITDHHLPQQLTARGYRVFVVDLRGSGASHRIGMVGWLNRGLREATPLREFDGQWNVDDQVRFDIPAVLEYVEKETGSPSVNWVGHSLGGMIMFPFLELTDRPDRIRNFVAMGSPVILDRFPQTQMLRANRGLQVLLSAISTGRIARPMAIARPPGLDKVDRLYYTEGNVDRRTVSRFYGYTLEDPGPGALKQLEVYLERGRMVSADGRHDYGELLPRVETPALFIVGDADLMANSGSMIKTYRGISSKDKSLLSFGKKNGHIDDYGHCDLVWSRYAPKEIFPVVIDWLDARQPGPPIIIDPSPQATPSPQAAPSPQQDGVGDQPRP
jgi:lysosomal acid lipase/cholesteryl ester hydrolase